MPSFAAPACWSSPPISTAALAVARGDALRRGADEIVVIGGTDIFAQTMPLADRLEITHVHARPEGDTCFPPIDSQALARGRAQRASGRTAGRAAFTYATYVRA